VWAWVGVGETLQAVLARLAEGRPGSGPVELISVLTGAGAPLGPEVVEGMVNGAVELELRNGGQTAYWWLLAAE